MKQKQPPLDVSIRAQFRVNLDSPSTLEEDFQRLFDLRQHLRRASPKLSEWYLGGDSKAEALLHKAFDESGPTTAAQAVLREKYRKDTGPFPSRIIGVWNGEDGLDGASMSTLTNLFDAPSTFNFSTTLPDFLSFEHVSAAVLRIAELWQPTFVTVATTFYRSTFRDRPGVGWMLYLPKVLIAEQFPEARKLVPVTIKDDTGREQQIGTLIASVVDEVFSDLKLEHMKVAHAIERRMVDREQLPLLAHL